VSGRCRRALIDLIRCSLAGSTFIRFQGRLCPLFEGVRDSFHRYGRYGSDRRGCVNLRGNGVLKVMLADSEDKAAPYHHADLSDLTGLSFKRDTTLTGRRPSNESFAGASVQRSTFRSSDRSDIQTYPLGVRSLLFSLLRRSLNL
jgi:hypothetical protein